MESFVLSKNMPLNRIGDNCYLLALLRDIPGRFRNEHLNGIQAKSKKGTSENLLEIEIELMVNKKRGRLHNPTSLWPNSGFGRRIMVNPPRKTHLPSFP